MLVVLKFLDILLCLECLILSGFDCCICRVLCCRGVTAVLSVYSMVRLVMINSLSAVCYCEAEKEAAHCRHTMEVTVQYKLRT